MKVCKTGHCQKQCPVLYWDYDANPQRQEEEKERQKEMGKTLKRLVSYYKPYKGLFFSDLFFAILGAGITLVIPLIVRYITSSTVIVIRVVNAPIPEL